MPRLPEPGNDKNTWGNILNDFLLESHTATGRLRDEIVDETKLTQEVRLKLNAAAPSSGTASFSVVNGTDTVKLYSGSMQAAVFTAADATHAGILNATDKLKLDSVQNGAQLNAVTSVSSRTGAVVLTKQDVNLSEVDNTSDLNKPVSTATQSALDAKANTVHTHDATEIVTGIVLPARLGTGVASANSYLRGDGAWAVLPDTLHVSSTVKTAAYTLSLADDSKAVEINVSSAVNLTIPSSASVNFPIGTVIEIVQVGTGQVVLVPGGGVVLRTPSTLTTRTTWSTIGLRKRAVDEWIISGDLV